MSKEDCRLSWNFTINNFSSTHINGYWYWAVPITKIMKKNKLVTKFWNHIMSNRTKDIKWRLGNYVDIPFTKLVSTHTKKKLKNKMISTIKLTQRKNNITRCTFIYKKGNLNSFITATPHGLTFQFNPIIKSIKELNRRNRTTINYVLFDQPRDSWIDVILSKLTQIMRVFKYLLKVSVY